MEVNGVQDLSVYSGKKYIKTDDGSVYKKANTGTVACGVFAGNAVGSAAIKPIQKVFRKPALAAIKQMEILNYIKGGNPLNRELSETAKDFIKAVNKAYKNSGLSEKGVQFVDVKSMSDMKDLEKALPAFLNRFPKLKARYVSMLDKAKKAILDGKNAGFVPNINKIYVNNSKMSYAAFHEMGHAMNKHLSTFGKILQKSRKPGVVLASVAMMTGIFKRKKVEGEQPKGVFDKVTTFIKDYCGPLAALGMLPTILEEAMASYNGAKLAKNLISPKNYKLLKSFQGKALLTYIGTSIALTTATILASKIRDIVAKPEKIK